MVTWIFGILGTLVLGYIAWLKSRVSKVTKEKDKAIVERDSNIIKVKVEQGASEIKNELISKKKENSKEKQEELGKVDKIEGGELSEEVKVAAAAQSERAAARARKLSERSKRD